MVLSDPRSGVSPPTIDRPATTAPLIEPYGRCESRVGGDTLPSRTEDQVLARCGQEESHVSRVGVSAVPVGVSTKDGVHVAFAQIGVAIIDPIEADQTSLEESARGGPGVLDLSPPTGTGRPRGARVCECPFLGCDDEQALLDRTEIVPARQPLSTVDLLRQTHIGHYRREPVDGCGRSLRRAPGPSGPGWPGVDRERVPARESGETAAHGHLMTLRFGWHRQLTLSTSSPVPIAEMEPAQNSKKRRSWCQELATCTRNPLWFNLSRKERSIREYSSNIKKFTY